MKLLLIAQRLILQNRWLWLLLLLWPWMMALVLMAGARPSPEDVTGLMGQECWYGLALAAFTGGALLENEQRSRRAALVLSRAISRQQYFLALWLTAVLPLVVYAACCGLSAQLIGVDAGVAARVCVALVALGSWVASVSLLASVYLPRIVASGLGLLPVATLVWVPDGVTALSLAAPVRMLRGPGPAPPGFSWGVLESVLLATAFLGLAMLAFASRDLRLKGE